MKFAKNITELIGNTPLLQINSFGGQIFAKAEFLNPGLSVKDRIALAMLDEALKAGKINKDSLIIEPTSGNTGVGLAMVAAALGLKAIFVMPSSMSKERQLSLKAYGAQLELTEPSLGMKGAVDKANELAKNNANSFIPSQFDNKANPQIHYTTTAQEILAQTDGKIDYFVAGFGTGGTVSGVGKALKEKLPNVKIIAVEPAASALATTGKAGPHAIQGIGANFIPQNLDRSVIDEIVTVSNEDAITTTKSLAVKEGILVGISAGANVFASSRIAKENPSAVIVTILPDTGTRYFSTGIFE
ncbi:MAG: cysteine synthase A [Rhodocyclaceae bacterium]